MNTSIDTVILGVLDIIGYTNDKPAFAAKFRTAYERQAVVNLIAVLPEEKRDQLRGQMQSSASPEATAAILKEHFSVEEYRSAIEAAAKDAFQQYLAATTPTLSPQQVQALRGFLTSLSPAHV